MHEARINNTLIRYPSEWNELSRHQLETIAGLSAMSMAEMSFKTQLLFYVAGIMVNQGRPVRDPSNKSDNLFQVKLRNGSTAYLSAEQVMELANGFDFLFRKSQDKEGNVSMSLDSSLTVNLVPSFVLRGHRYYGPSNNLFNITFSEFIHAETNLSRFIRTKEIQHLDKLIAVLYRPSHHAKPSEFKGDRRAPFNDHLIDDRSVKIHRLNHNVKMAILLFYQGCQAWLKNQFPHVFGGKKSGKDDGLGFMGLVDALTGGDVSKTDQIRASYLMDVMVHLERSAVEYEKLEAKKRK